MRAVGSSLTDRQIEISSGWSLEFVLPTACEGQPWVWEKTDIDFLGLVMRWPRHLPLIVNADKNSVFEKRSHPETHRTRVFTNTGVLMSDKLRSIQILQLKTIYFASQRHFCLQHYEFRDCFCFVFLMCVLLFNQRGLALMRSLALAQVYFKSKQNYVLNPSL